MKRKLLVVVLAALVGLIRPAPASDSASIYETLSAMKDHTILFVAVTEAKDGATLKGQGPYTLFAPTDAAFKKLDDATIKKLATDKDIVKTLLRAHLAVGNLTATDLKKLTGKQVRTLQGNALKLEDTKDGLRVGEAKVTGGSIACSNGVIHIIDAVLPIVKE